MSQNLFKWKHFRSDIIMLCVRWYLKYPLSYRMLVEMMQERGLNLTHTTIMRWVHQYSPVICEKLRKHIKPTNDSWRMDETYLKIKGTNAYLYRAVDSEGKTIDFFVSEHRDKDATKKFFSKALKAIHNQQPRVITTDKYAATEVAIYEMIYNGILSVSTSLRKVKYMNNIIEQDHRFIKRKVKPMLGFDSFETAEKTLCGIETMHMIRKGQIEEIQSVLSEVEFLNNIMGIVA
ncbi:IS6 family transposase [Pelosinus sp. sgz500959]|uniref:IS6 family transposase n=1 Tax=Pelosinus sp. sgz500959 TaxID=3242472 RepID=UPI00366EF470